MLGAVLHPNDRVGSISASGSEHRPGPPGRGRLNEEAYHHIRDAILRGDYAAGAVLAETDIAAALGSSRTPVRHALGLLLREGLLEVGPRRQVIVRGFTPERVAEILLLREALETVAVGRACETITDEKLDALRLLILRQRRAGRKGDADAFLELDEDFHLQIAEAAELPILRGVLGQLRGFVRLARIDAAHRSSTLDEVADEHDRLVDALERRDADTARTLLSTHLLRHEDAP
jgi:DNA-binding GntR family transcriptional regulator